MKALTSAQPQFASPDMSIFTDPIFLRAIERIVLALAGAYLGLLGYKLFLYGMASGKSAPGPQSRIVTALYPVPLPAFSSSSWPGWLSS